MIRSIILLFFLSLGFNLNAQTKTLPERLGYPSDTKLLIIHADDLGVSHAENAASIQVMENGLVNSASIMVPCPWFPEIAAYAKAHPQADFGLHLTLTSEWNVYKWGPVTVRDQVSSLVNGQGYLNESNSAFTKSARLAEVEKELRSQIDRAIQFGVDPTHLDAHMFAAEANPEILEIFLKLGREYRVPVHIASEIVIGLFQYDPTKFMTDKDIRVDHTIMMMPDDYKNGVEKYYTNQMKSLKSGLHVILLHAAFDNDEMQAVTMGHPDFGAAWRQQDVNFFSSEKCKKIISEEKIKLITWREIRDKLLR